MYNTQKIVAACGTFKLDQTERASKSVAPVLCTFPPSMFGNAGKLWMTVKILV